MNTANRSAVSFSNQERISSEKPDLLNWQRAVKQANFSFACHDDATALQQYHTALRLAELLLKSWLQADRPSVAIDQVLAALVVSHHNLATLHIRRGEIVQAALHLCDAHQRLYALNRDISLAAELRNATRRHAHISYAELASFNRQHAGHTAVMASLQLAWPEHAVSPSLH